MKRLFITMFIYLLIGCYYADSQNTFSVDNLDELWIEMEIEEEEGMDYEEFWNELLYLANYPLDINRATIEEWKQIPFLTDAQIEELIAYTERYGDMVSIYELKNIQTLDYKSLRMLLPFVYINENPVNNRTITVDNLFKYGRNELITRFNKSFQQKKGYYSLPDSILEVNPNKKYLGEPFYHSIRYSYTYDTHVQAGIIAEKDAGEPFWNEYHKGYDYYSFHMVLKDINRLKTFVAGDYKSSFGQGLVMSQDYSPGRSAMVVQADRRTNGFRRHFSTNEFDYLRGVAATYSVFPTVDISFFYSLRRMDGITDSVYIRSIKKDGLHRIERDQERKRNISLQSWGGNIRYATHSLVVGFTGVMTSWGDQLFHPEEKPYNLYHFRGKDHLNIGVDYLWKRKAVKIFGETAWSQNGGMATLHGIQVTPASYVSFLALYRYYDKQYYSFYGKAFSQQSQVQNEEGVYVGIRFTPFPYWKLSAYADLFRFPWLRYGVDAPSRGKEYMIQVDHTLSSTISFYLRYRLAEKEKNYSENPLRTIQSYQQQKIQVQMRAEVGECSFRSSVEYGIYSFQERKDKGFLFSQAAGWKPERFPIRLDLFAGWFRTDDYSVRFRSFEKTVLYDFYSPTLYGQGIRLSGMFQWEIIKRLFISTKLAHVIYKDRETVGTGLEEIEGNKKTDFYMQLRWKF